MLNTVRELLLTAGIEKVAPVRLCDCRITRGYLLERAGISNGSALMFCVPYYTTECDSLDKNISSYAVSGDYHVFFNDLFEDILPKLRQKFPEHKFAGFTDHSPIDERAAAVAAGLGSIGKNHLFLTHEYSSFVFLGEIITDALLDTQPCTHKVCLDCGACLAACPVNLDGWKCLSGLTQKKGTLTEEEKTAILQSGSLWGCDRCQDACPVTKAARNTGTLYSNIPYFQRTALAHLDAKTILEMDEETFRHHAYSWRGREVIMRNVSLFEEDKS